MEAAGGRGVLKLEVRSSMLGAGGGFYSSCSSYHPARNAMPLPLAPSKSPQDAGPWRHIFTRIVHF